MQYDMILNDTIRNDAKQYDTKQYEQNDTRHLIVHVGKFPAQPI